MRESVLCISALIALAGCGDGPEDLAFAQCKDEINKAFGPAAAAGPAGDLRDDPVYGWHMDVETDPGPGSGPAGYRCLFLVEGRQAPLFLAVVER